MTDFLEYQSTSPDAAPPWLSDERGTAWNEVLGIAKDAIRYGVREAIRQRFAKTCALDALHEVARDRRLDLGYRENESRMRARLGAAWDQWASSNRVAGMKLALSYAGYTDVAVIESVHDASLAWWEFDIVLFGPFPWPDHYLDNGRWDDATTRLWGDAAVWPEDVPDDEIALIRAIGRRRPTHTRLRKIVLVHNGVRWDDDTLDTWDDSTLATWSEDTTEHNP